MPDCHLTLSGCWQALPSGNSCGDPSITHPHRKTYHLEGSQGWPCQSLSHGHVHPALLTARSNWDGFFHGRSRSRQVYESKRLGSSAKVSLDRISYCVEWLTSFPPQNFMEHSVLGVHSAWPPNPAQLSHQTVVTLREHVFSATYPYWVRENSFESSDFFF